MRSRGGEHSVRSKKRRGGARVYFRRDLLVIFVETKADISTLFHLHLELNQVSLLSFILKELIPNAAVHGLFFS